MAFITFEIADDILTSLNESAEEFISDIRLTAALRLFEKGKISIGKASILAGVEKYIFINECGKNNIPVIHYNPEELANELAQFERDV